MHETLDAPAMPYGSLVARLLGERHPLPLSIALHLVPGILIGAAYVLFGIPLAAALGYPSLLGYLVVTPFVFVPVELGLLFYLGRKLNARWSLTGVVGYRNKLLRRGILAAFVAALLLWTFVSSALLAPLDAVLYEWLVSAIPARFFLGGGSDTPFMGYARTTTLVTLLVWLILGGIALPTVEEFYFRGYLLPRLNHLGRWAPVLNMVLFAIYHVWSPWQVFSRIAFFLPTVWATWRNQDLRISVWVHCLANTLGVLLTLAAVVAGTSP